MKSEGIALTVYALGVLSGLWFGFAIGQAHLPAAQIVVAKGDTVYRDYVRTVDAPVPSVVYLEREARPHPNQCVVTQ